MVGMPSNDDQGPASCEPTLGEEILITGFSGNFPDSDSLNELAENLFNKADLISGDGRRWKVNHPEIPQRTGKLKQIAKFDASFFNIDYKQAEVMEPSCRIILEKVYEALIDAGINPVELRNTNTGVFIAVCFGECEKNTFYDRMQINGNGVIGSSRAMFAHRVSSWLGLKAPSHVVDTACSSSLYAIEVAYKSILRGQCDMAIVGGVNLCMAPRTSLEFFRMGVLSSDGKCKSFDDNASGYVRSEAIAACILQKAKDSRRAYAQMIHAKTNCDGYKEQGISYPAGHVQKLLLKDFYEECGISPTDVEYVEAHATGTIVGDPEEMSAIDEVFCTGRSEPLLIGAVKSNLGHSEATSGLCSLAKMCIAYNTGFIPPNINYKTPRKGIKALEEGRVHVVTEKHPWGRGLVAVNSFGFGGANAHTLLKNFARAKVRNGLPSEDLPRLVCVSGRTESAVNKILDDLLSRPVDVDLVRLWHAIHARDIPNHPLRGFVLLGSTPTKSVSLARDVQVFSKSKRDVWFQYSSLNAPSSDLVSQLMKIKVFADSIQKCHNAMEPKGVNLIKIITEPHEGNLLHSLLTTTSVHVGFTDLLKAIGIQHDHLNSQDIGKFGCAYAGGILSADQVILAAFSVGLASTSTPINTDPELLKYLTDVMASLEAHAERWSSDPQSDSVVIELAPSEQTWPRNKNIVSVELTQSNHSDPVVVLFTALGKLFELGLNMELANLYPEVTLPVAVGTPMLSHLVEWQHSDTWFVIGKKNVMQNTIETRERTVQLSLDNENLDFISGHCIDGRIVVPATCYLVMVWETLALYHDQQFTDVSVVFDNISLHRLTYMPAKGSVDMVISLQWKSGSFEILENGTVIARGQIRMKDHEGKAYPAIPPAVTKDEDDKIVMKTKDFYKERYLRGYEYKDIFCGVQKQSVSGTKARLAWIDNWISFLDTMVQTVPDGSRNLRVPLRIDSITIDVALQKAAIEESLTVSNEKSLDLAFYPELGIIRCGGVEMRGLHAATISRKPVKGIPVFEKSHFVSNYSTTERSIEDAIRADIQLIYENVQTYKFKGIELVDEEYKNHKLSLLTEKVADVLADLPLVQAEQVVLSKETLELPEKITVVDKNITDESNATLFIGANLLQRQEVLQQALDTLKDGCFIFSRELTRPDPKDFPDYSIVTIQNIGSENIVLLRRKPKVKPTKFVKIVTEDNTYSWIESVKEELKDGQRLVLYSQGESVNGLLGLVNCLRREPGGETVSGILIADPQAPEFNPELQLYKEQLDLDLGVNVYMNGEWGTYRHLLLEELKPALRNHAYVNYTTVGDLSSLRWLEGAIKDQVTKDQSRKIIIHVYCSALNFRDVMTAMGRVTVDSVARGRIAQECVQGIEVVGRTANGSRVMALCEKGISNIVESERSLVIAIPDEWSFEEAATVPVVYSTVYLALLMIGKLKRGESVLIHSGAGGVGQAAINVALHCGCEVFTTVGTPDKRAFIKKLFPQLKDSNIGNSRDTSFEDMIRRETNGKGVNVVLNALADDKLLASTRCLSRRGRFLEMGKYDITNNTLINMYIFKKEISFHGIMLDHIFDEQSTKLRLALQNLVMIGIQTGAIRPITYTTFEKNEVEAAYRYMAAGKHIGKIILKIRDADEGVVKPKLTPIMAVPRYACDEDHVYVLVGGLGGFGLELADWLILRGARKLVLNSRRGISNGYQRIRLREWKTYGTDVRISTHGSTTEAGCKEMLSMANEMGTVSAIFNLAVILRDAVFTNQTPDTFRESFAPKAQATMNLDKLSRQMCPELRDFVIFSSVSCGRGNAGQTNYGFSNSVMERICEERRKHRLPALAIQWGAIGDVGLVADMQENNIQLEIGGTLQQRISSCLQAMDRFLMQDATIVSSMVVAEKKSGVGTAVNAVEAVALILGITDLKMVSKQAALPELGLDSITAVEIKQTLEREFEIFLTAQEIRSLTFARLYELTTQTDSTSAAEASAPVAPGGAFLGVLMRNIGDEEMAYKDFIYLPSKASIEIKVDAENSPDVLFLVPGLESSASVLEPLCRNLDITACALQLGVEHRNDTLETMIDRLHKVVKPQLTAEAPFRLLGYSFGALIVLELAAKLESEGHEGIVFCLDGAPDFLQMMAANKLKDVPDRDLENMTILHVTNMVLPNNDIAGLITEKISGIASFEERIECALKLSPVPFNYSIKFLTELTLSAVDRFKTVINYKSMSKQLKSPIVLLRQKQIPGHIVCDEDYGLQKCTEAAVTVHKFDNDHITIVDNVECANVINKALSIYSESRVEIALSRRLGN